MTEPIKDGGPAFPLDQCWNCGDLGEGNGFAGMTLRDYAELAVLPSFLSGWAFLNPANTHDKDNIKRAVVSARMIADEWLAAREKGGE